MDHGSSRPRSKAAPTRAIVGVSAFALVLVLVLAVGAVGAAPAPSTSAAAARHQPDGQRDFDFELGDWRTRLRVLANPLSGETPRWLEFEGTSIVRPLLGGRANVVELDVSGATGSIVGVSLRLYDPATHEWSLNFANARVGKLVPPSVGRFKDGRGAFLSREEVDGREVLVRFDILPITADSIHFEQYYSPDSGKTWERNWLAIDTRRR